MRATQQLHELGQSLWLDNITRALLTSGTLSRYLREFAVTGLTSNPTIFDQAIQRAGLYDDAIREKAAAGKSGEALFFELALEDLVRAGVDINALAVDLLRDGTKSFAASWSDLLDRIASKSHSLTQAKRA